MGRTRRRWTVVVRGFVAVALVSLAGLIAWTLLRVLAGTASGQDPRFGWPLELRDRVNVLLIGVDVTINNRKQVVPNLARADTLILMSFDPHGRRAVFLSIPRDTRAEIPGHGTWKINASYAFGGVPLTVRTVEHLLGVRIPYVVKLGPQSFARLIDAVGGVWVDVEQDMYYHDWWGDLTIDLKKGRQLLSGHQAMGYARFRKDALGDIGRTHRQQKVIRALFARLREPQTLLRAPEILEVLRTHTQTNLTPQKILTLAWFLRSLPGDRVEMATLPGRFAPLFWDPDWQKVRALVCDWFYGIPADMVARTRVEVLNASGVPGMAREVADRLARFGFPVVRVENAPTLRHETAILSHRADRRVTRAVRAMLGVGSLAHRRTDRGDVDLTVLVGRDYAHRSLLAHRSTVP